MRILDYIFGYCRIDFAPEDATRVHNLLYRLHVEYRNYGEDENGGYLFIRARQREYVRAFAAEEKIPLQFGRIEGVPRIFLRYSNRYGMILGIFAALTIVVASGFFAWDVRVEGNERLTDAEVIEALGEYGAEIGCFLPTLDLRHVANSVLINSEDIGWISLYRRGNVLYAKVLEKEDTTVNDTSPPARGNAANLVAKHDAVILSYALERGRPVLPCGAVVKKGDMIVTGVLTGRDGTSFVEAAGAVYGQVTHTLTVEIPFETSVTRVDGTKKLKKEIIFFGNRIKFSQKGGNLPTTYDTIENKEQISLFGRIPLPIYVCTSYAVMTHEESVTLSEVDAVRLAYRRMNAEERRILADATLMMRECEGHFEDGVYKLSCHLTVSQNIAEQIPFEVQNDESGNPKN